MIKTVHIDGYNYTYHPKPEGYEPHEWFKMVSTYHTSKGHVVVEVLASVEHKKTHEVYPLKNELESWGVEAKWFSR